MLSNTMNIHDRAKSVGEWERERREGGREGGRESVSVSVERKGHYGSVHVPC